MGLADMNGAHRLDHSTIEVIDGDIYVHGWTV
jgi:hypothetical protein